jgi:tetratricopeptide (TPR) repeat protein
MTGQTDKAREQYRLLLQQNPPQVSSYLEALAFYEDQGDAASLARTLEGLESLAPHDPRLLYFRSVSRIIRGAELDQAEAELKQFLHSYPGRSDSVTLGEGHFALGTVYEKGAKWRAAYDEYRQAALLEPYRKRFRKAAERTEKQARKEEKK